MDGAGGGAKRLFFLNAAGLEFSELRLIHGQVKSP